jgi:hypothetical protein
MGYYMRFILTDDSQITLSDIEKGLKKQNALYLIKRQNNPEQYEFGEFYLGEELLGEIEINKTEGDQFSEEIDEFIEDIQALPKRKTKKVLRFLKECKAIICLRVLWQKRETEATLQMIDPLWDWLFEHRKGIVQADSEGYYTQNKCILNLR